MKPFDFKHGDKAWDTESQRLLHVYVLPEPDTDGALLDLAARARKAGEAYPITWVENQWLHATVDQITGKDAAAYTQAERDDLIALLTRRLAAVEPFTALIGSPMTSNDGVLCDHASDAEFAALYEVVHTAIGDARGPESILYPRKEAHVTFGYANDKVDLDGVEALQRSLRKSRPTHAPMTVRQVHLVDVKATNNPKTITWDLVASIELGAT